MRQFGLPKFWVTLQRSQILSTLVRGAGASLSVQLISLGSLYTAQILLARWMGVTQYGIYEYVIALDISLVLLAGLGLPTAALRFVSEYRVKQDWSRLRGLLQGSWQQTVIASCVTALCSTGVLLWLNGRHVLPYATPLLVGVWLIPLMALINLQQQIIRAFQQIVLAYAPAAIAQPIVLVGIAGLWQTQADLNPTVVIVLAMVSLLGVLMVQSIVFRWALPLDIFQTEPVFALDQWWQVALPLMLFDGSYLVLSQSDTLMIGSMLGVKAVGLYGAAIKTSLWVHFILAAVNAISAPMIASLYAQGDRQGLQQLVSTIARWMFYPALAIALGLIVFAEPVLQLFGTEFIAAKTALIILIVGQLVNVGAGSVGYLMMMTGHQSQSAWVMGVSALVNILLNGIGIHWFGIAGAALATTVAMVLWNVWLHILVVKHLQVHPSILATFR